MARTVYGLGEIAAWNAAMDEKKPAIVEEIEWPDFPQIEAFAPMALNVGMAIRMAARNGDIINFTINPVAARHLAACILKMGQAAGWLDEKADVICPPFPGYDA